MPKEQNPKPELHKTLEELTKSIEGGGSCFIFYTPIDEGDISVKYCYVSDDFTKEGTNMAYFCQTCDGFYCGKAPVNNKGQRYCECCEIIL